MRQRYTWTLPRLTAELGDRTAIMGIPDVTPDSFSDGGQYFDVAPIGMLKVHEFLRQGPARGR